MVTALQLRHIPLSTRMLSRAIKTAGARPSGVIEGRPRLARGAALRRVCLMRQAFVLEANSCTTKTLGLLPVFPAAGLLDSQSHVSGKGDTLRPRCVASSTAPLRQRPRQAQAAVECDM